MQNINNEGLPARYELIRNSLDALKYGIVYKGSKKEEVILEPEYSICTVFKALGRVFLAYMVQDGDESYYVIRDKKGKTVFDQPVFDFVANNKILYVQIRTERGIELAALNKELEVLKTFGEMKFDDYYTNRGNRILPNTRQTLDVLDKYNHTCRINLTDNTMDEVITFSKEAKARNSNGDTVSEEPFVEEWQYEFNMTTGRVMKSDGLGGHIHNIANIKGMEKFKDTLVVLMNETPKEISSDVLVKRHYEKHDVLQFNGIDNERAELVDKLLLSVRNGYGLDFIDYMLSYFKNDLENTVKAMTEGFENIIEHNENGVESLYSFKMMTTSDKAVIMIKNTYGKMCSIIKNADASEICKAAEGDMWTDEDYEVTSLEVGVSNLSFEDSCTVPKPLGLHKNKHNSYYERGFLVAMGVTPINHKDVDELPFKLAVFDRFAYGPLVKDNDKDGARHNYNDKNIVLKTVTSDFYVELIA